MAPIIRQDLYVTDGTVNAVVVSGNTLYLAGGFSRVGPATGGGVPLDKLSGIPVAGFPRVAGIVFAVVPDGAGGWYIGGSFAAVGGLPRPHLAHVLADNSVSAWDPHPDGEIYALAVNGTTVYASGLFASVGGADRDYLAALDATTGEATAWDPNAENVAVALAVSGSTVYAAGYFTSIGGQARNGLAALGAGGFATAWDPNPDGAVLTLVTSGATVYAAGYFTSIGGQARNNLAALDATTGDATPWSPDPNEVVFALAVDGSTVYAGGGFTTIGGQARNGLAALDAATGFASAWNPDVGGAGALAVSGTTVFASGGSILALDSATGLPLWSAQPNFATRALAASGSAVYAGGEFTSIGGQARNGLAALNVTTGEVTGWDPDLKYASGPPKIDALAVSGSIVYVGGRFTHVGEPTAGGALRNNIAALDAATGLPTAWDPDASGGYGGYWPPSVSALAVSGSTVYVGGRFSHIGGQTRNYIAALDAATGQATAWNPSANDSVSTLVVHGTTVYAAGTFNRIGAQTRNGIAALDAAGVDSTTGIVTAWDPDPIPPSSPAFRDENGVPYAGRGPIRTLAVRGATVYAGGSFDFMGGFGGPRRVCIAALDAATGLATAWDPNLLPSGFPFFVSALVVNGSTVYAGGAFGTIGGEARNFVAALDSTTGLATPWDPNAGGPVRALALIGTTVYAGGDFRTIGGQPQSGIAAMGDLTTPTLLSLVSADATPDRVRLTWFAADGLGLRANVYRREEQSDWRGVTQVWADGTGRIEYVDTQVTAGARYGYRLGVLEAGTEEFLGETWVDVPRAAEFALAGPRPNPASGELTIVFSLPDASPARLEVLDLAGRRLAAREVGALGPGSHVVSLARARPLAPGVYHVRLARGDRSITRRAVVVR